MTPMLLALWLALDIQGTLTCPTPAEVSQHLARLVPESGSPGQIPRAYLSAGESFLAIELLGPEGVFLAERKLDRSASCADMAEAVAVILATWQAKFSPTLSPTTFAPVTSAPAEVAPWPGTVPQRPVLFDAGIAALVPIVGSEATLGAKLEGALSPFAHGLGFHLALSLASTHTQTIPQTIRTPSLEAQWIRPALSLGPNLRLHGNTVALDIHGDAVVALVRVNGSGLSQTSSDTSMQFGLAAGLRGLWIWKHSAAWVGTDLLGYPGQDNLSVANLGQVGRLPRLEFQISLGIVLGRFR